MKQRRAAVACASLALAAGLSVGLAPAAMASVGGANGGAGCSSTWAYDNTLATANNVNCYQARANLQRFNTANGQYTITSGSWVGAGGWSSTYGGAGYATSGGSTNKNSAGNTYTEWG
ncbi:MAG: hypothetical protein LBE60_11120 [Microbacterium sp.]|uniref:hypothetical protein n=1 Tax=Microbacterium sp. TaxID=51671 RepID=UPI00281EAEF1|nr:hypothetical protein [Microbacterium sp.]MDR2322184.1 hypothetical protein [Microbacterium sp.]